MYSQKKQLVLRKVEFTVILEFVHINVEFPNRLYVMDDPEVGLDKVVYKEFVLEVAQSSQFKSQ